MTLDDLRKLEAAATEGPWEADCGEIGPTAGTSIYHVATTCPYETDDAALIAALRNAAPALLDFVAAAKEEAEFCDDGCQCLLCSGIYVLNSALAVIDTGKGEG